MKKLVMLVLVGVYFTNMSLLAQQINDLLKSEYLILYSSDKSGNPEIYLADIDHNIGTKLTDYVGRDGYPACSPNGKQIAFYCYYDHGNTWSINVMDMDGKNRKRLTHTKNVYDTAPKWSPDGSKIIFGRDNKNTLEIWMMNSDGNNLHQIELISGGTPSFTNDGNILFCSHWDQHGEIFIADTLGNIIQKVTSNNVGEWFAEMSPDGTEIIYSANDDDIYIVDIDGSNERKVIDTDYTESSPHWSVDGKKILFTSNMDGDYDIYVIGADGTNLKNVTENEVQDIQANWIIKQKQ